MSDPFIGEIRMFSFDFAPRYWASCDGQSIPITQNQQLYALINTIYGGSTISFNLPDYRGRTPMHFGNTSYMGDHGGSETVPLSAGYAAAHSHDVRVTQDTATETAPSTTATMGNTETIALYGDEANLTSLNSSMLAPQGSSQAHNNMQPSLTVNFCISLQGLWPSRT